MEAFVPTSEAFAVGVQMIALTKAGHLVEKVAAAKPHVAKGVAKGKKLVCRDW